MKQRLITAAIGIPIFISVSVALWYVLAAVTLILLSIALVETNKGLARSEVSIPPGLKALIWLYPLLLLSIPLLRQTTTSHGSFASPDYGARLFLSAVFSVWATDSFAYFGGKAFGKRKLAPNVSPNKTVEGSAIGATFGIVIGLLFGKYWLGSISLGVAIGICGGIIGQLGDLLESAIKRRLGIKDFGGLLPGHGGVLDRFDSMMLVCSILCLLVRFAILP